MWAPLLQKPWLQAQLDSGAPWPDPFLPVQGSDGSGLGHMSVTVDGGEAPAPAAPCAPRAGRGLDFQEVTFPGAVERGDFTWMLSGAWSVCRRWLGG